MSKVITRKEYERLPKPLEGMWLTDMQDMADELKERCVGEIPEVDELMAGLISKAAKCLEEVEQKLAQTIALFLYFLGNCVNMHLFPLIQNVQKQKNALILLVKNKAQKICLWRFAPFAILVYTEAQTK